MVEPSGHRWVIRIAAAAFLFGCATALLVAGDFAPHWLSRTGEIFGVAPSNAVRILAAALAAMALAALGTGAWACGCARVGLVVALFASLATVSGTIKGPAPTLVVAALTTAIGCALFLALRRRSPQRSAVHVSDAWRIVTLVALFSTAFAVAARVPMREQTTSPANSPRHGILDEAAGAIDLAVNTWEGKTLEETGLFEHLPALRGLFESTPPDEAHGDVTYLIFYNTRCGHCHHLFEQRFAGHLDVRVVAIRIPYAESDPVIPSDQPEDITCPECVRMSLPVGRMWVITPPTVVRIEGGVVSCANEPPQRKSCFGP